MLFLFSEIKLNQSKKIIIFRTSFQAVLRQHTQYLFFQNKKKEPIPLHVYKPNLFDLLASSVMYTSLSIQRNSHVEFKLRVQIGALLRIIISISKNCNNFASYHIFLNQNQNSDPFRFEPFVVQHHIKIKATKVTVLN